MKPFVILVEPVDEGWAARSPGMTSCRAATTVGAVLKLLVLMPPLYGGASENTDHKDPVELAVISATFEHLNT